MQKSEPLLGDMIDELWGLREKLRRIQAQAKAKTDPIEHQMSVITQKLQDRMKEVGTDKAGGKKGSYSFSEPDEFVLVDPAKFYAWMKETGNVHCLQRRLAQKALAEVAAKRRGGKIPGLKTEPVPRGTLTTLGGKK